VTGVASETASRAVGRAVLTGIGYALVVPPVAALASTIAATIWVAGQTALPAEYLSSPLVALFFLLMLYHYLLGAMPLFLIGMVMGSPQIRRFAWWERALTAASLTAFAVFLFWLIQQAADEPLLPKGLLQQSSEVAIWGGLMMLSVAIVASFVGRDRSYSI
jgi:hypothetical protein